MAELRPDDIERLLSATTPDDSPDEALVFADYFLERGDKRMAAAAFDRAYGLAPERPEIGQHRQLLLDELAVVEHGLIFRYVPAGSFLMGSDQGDPDERPVHPVRVQGYWMAEIPTTWAAFCDLMGWRPPPNAFPAEETFDDRRQGFFLYEENKLRLQYCESGTLRARDWHAHHPDLVFRSGDQEVSAVELFGVVQREDQSRPLFYDVKPMVAVSWRDVEALCERLSTPEVRYQLPSEAQWERAARGGLIGKRYPWGDEPPTQERCDFDAFGRFSLRAPKAFPPNGYGLYSMAGGVWEWTSDDYDALAYRASRPEAPAQRARERVLRGGSWADSAAAVSLSFRTSRPAGWWRDAAWGDHLSPTIGFRLCRVSP